MVKESDPGLAELFLPLNCGNLYSFVKKKCFKLKSVAESWYVIF